MITYLRGDATVPQAKGPKLIAHVVNDLGGWGKGFVLSISRRWPEPEKAYRRWHAERAQNDFALGAIQVVQVKPDTHVVNMLAQRGIGTGSKGPPIRYEALAECLQKLRRVADEHKASIHMPRIGCGLAGGKWRATHHERAQWRGRVCVRLRVSLSGGIRHGGRECDMRRKKFRSLPQIHPAEALVI